MGVTAVGGNNAGLNARAATFARSIVFKLIDRPHFDVFHQERRIPPRIDLHMKLMAFQKNFVCESTAFDQGFKQKNYMLVFQSVNLIIYTKYLTVTAYYALMDLVVSQNMVHNYSRAGLKHLSIPANQTSINFDNVFTGVYRFSHS